MARPKGSRNKRTLQQEKAANASLKKALAKVPGRSMATRMLCCNWSTETRAMNGRSGYQPRRPRFALKSPFWRPLSVPAPTLGPIATMELTNEMRAAAYAALLRKLKDKGAG